MAVAGKIWTMTLKCHACNHRFVIGDIATDRIPIMPQIVPCPSCASKAVTTMAENNSQIVKTHSIVDLQFKKAH
jgi:hypothetical protein